MSSDARKEERANRLQLISRANEKLKDVLQLSRQVNVGAVNARLLSRQAGAASQGFRVAASELGTFSFRLDGVMTMVESVLFEAVNAAADLQKQLHRQRLLQAAAKDSNRDRVRSWAETSRQTIARNEGNVETGRMRLLAHLNRACVQADMGRVTARLAKLEAVHGGSLAQAMTDAVVTIEEIVLLIVETLRDLTKQFNQAI